MQTVVQTAWLVGLLVAVNEAFVVRPIGPALVSRECWWHPCYDQNAGSIGRNKLRLFLEASSSSRTLPLENNTARIDGLLDGIKSSSLVKPNGIRNIPIMQQLEQESEIAIASNQNSNSTVGSAGPKRVSVVLNMNARSVTEATVAVVRQVFGHSADIYVTRTEADAQAAVKYLIQSDIVVPIGGDGTLTYCLNLMKKQIQEKGPNQLTALRLPDIAYIPLGTGNAVGSVAGCVRYQGRRLSKLVQTLQWIQEAALNTSDADYSILELPMMEVQMTSTQHQATKENTTLCFFCGAGFDSLMLNDFRILQKWSRRRSSLFLRNLLGSVFGYCVALVTRTLPAAVGQQRHQVEVKITSASLAASNNSTTVVWLDHRRGDVAQRVTDSNSIVYEGLAGIVAASTVPYYGGRLRLFPFARVNCNTMHLRIGRIHPMTGFWNIPRIFAGTYRDTSERFGVLDFIGTDFEVQIQGTDGKEYPFQHSGESVGEIKSFRIKVAEEPIRFLSFWNKRKS